MSKKKNITLRLDEAILKQCRRQALEENRSLSDWLSGLMAERLVRENRFAQAKKKALLFLERGFSLGGKALSRDETHERS